jgi:cytochrome c oxidase subunit 2
MRKNKFFMGMLFILGLLIIAGCSNSPTGNVVKEIGNEPFTGEAKEFRVEAFQFGFDPTVIEVNQGDKVRIIASSRDVPHGFAIDEYGINLYLNGLRSETIEFIADKAGTFIYYCNVPCGGGHSSMRGKLIVK